jgi:hypothetical protein
MENVLNFLIVLWRARLDLFQESFADFYGDVADCPGFKKLGQNKRNLLISSP